MSLGGSCLTALIAVYRFGLSPILPGTCRFQPTCSAYALDAVRRFGASRGGALALRRLARCHPWGGWGYDPVPDDPVQVAVDDTSTACICTPPQGRRTTA